MKSRLPTLLPGLVLAVALHAQAGGETAGHHRHGHDGGEPLELQLNAGKKWATDAHLRQAMKDINQAMAGAVPLIHQDRFGEGDYRALAGKIRQKVAYAVEHCKLDARADAMLHLVIADLLAGAEAMEGADPHSRHDGAVRVLGALAAYGKHFRHPGWKAAGG